MNFPAADHLVVREAQPSSVIQLEESPSEFKYPSEQEPLLSIAVQTDIPESSTPLHVSGFFSTVNMTNIKMAQITGTFGTALLAISLFIKFFQAFDSPELNSNVGTAGLFFGVVLELASLISVYAEKCMHEGGEIKNRVDLIVSPIARR